MFLYYLLWVIIAFILIIGLSDIMGAIKNILFKKKDAIVLNILPLDGHVDNVEYLIRSELSNNQWNNRQKRGYLVIVNNGMDEETLKICKIMKEKEGKFSICRKEELGTMFFSALDLQKL